VVGGDEELGRAEGRAGDEDCGPDLQHCAEAREGPDEPEGNDDTERREDATDDSREKERIEISDTVECNDGCAQGPEGDGSGVGQEREACGLKRGEAQSDEDGSADGHGGPEACCAFEEGTECECDQQKL